MARRPAGMEPAPEIASYDDVPWFRKQWFAWVLVLFFFPPLVFIAATGDMFAKANRKMKEHDNAEVWRYTGGGKAMIFVAGVIFAVLFGIQLAVALTADDGRPRRASSTEAASSDDSGAAAADDDDADDDADEQDDATADAEAASAEPATTTTVVATTTVPPTTTTIVAGPVGEVVAEIEALASAGFVEGDLVTPVAAIVDQFPVVPAPADATFTDINVSGEIGTSLRAGTVLFNVFSNYETALSPAEVVALYRAEAPAADLPEREYVEDADDDGPFIDLDLGDFGSHPDPDIDWSVLNLRIRASDSGSTVRASHSVTRPITDLPGDSLLARLVAATPTGGDYVLDEAEISIREFEGSMSISTFVDVVAPRVVADGDGDAAEITSIRDAYLERGEFAVVEQDGDSVRFELPFSPQVRVTASVGFKNDEVTHIYNRTSRNSF